MLLALLNLITGNTSDDLVLWLYRLASSIRLGRIRLGFSRVLIWRVGREYLNADAVTRGRLFVFTLGR